MFWKGGRWRSDGVNEAETTLTLAGKLCRKNASW